MTQSTPAWIVLAHLLRPQGRKGEVLAELLTDFPERFEDQRRVFLAAPGFDGEEAEARPAEVVAFWLPMGKNEGRVVLQFAGIDTISDAESIAGKDVLVPREERLPLEDESVYISELIGCTVYDGSKPVGVVADVPFAKAFLVAVDTEAKRIDMTLPEGLIEINRSAGGGGISEDQK
jgi:16S rRNA processing protein RimM